MTAENFARPKEYAKTKVAEFWDAASCGETLYLPTLTREGYEEQARQRYALEPFIVEFAEFDRWRGKSVFEIGVGLGADHQRFAEEGARLTGIDLTPRAIDHVRRRFEALGLTSDLSVSDAEDLPFPDGTFDLVYCYGVIHHTPNTAAAAQEILRVLKPGGEFRVMIYHRRSLVGLMLWLRYGLATGHPFTTMTEIYARHLESPGTKAFTQAEAVNLFSLAEDVSTHVVLTHGDLLESSAGQRHRGAVLNIARAVWPRWLLRRIARGWGLFLFVTGRKRA
jgi:SAM-dependent methyltransferase